MSDMTEDELTRLVVARFTPGRFKGRQDLEVSAQRGDPVALAKLEMKLGLADESALRKAYEQRINRWLDTTTNPLYGPGPYTRIQKPFLDALAKTPPGKRLPVVEGYLARDASVGRWSSLLDLVPPEDLERIRQKQHNRLRKAAHSGHNHWYLPNPKYSSFERDAKNSLNAALQKSRRPGSKRFYLTNIKTVPVGEERVVVEKLPGWFRASVGRGWGSAVKKEWQYDPEGYTRLTWHVSPALLNQRTKALQAQNERNVYLAPNKRIRQGGGSRIVTEIFKMETPVEKRQMSFPWGASSSAGPRWMWVRKK